MSNAIGNVLVTGRPRTVLRGVVVVVGLLASLVAAVPTVGADPTVPFECSVEPADGGLLLSWEEVPGATSYQYKRDVASSGAAYQRVTGTSAFIPLADGLVASVGLAPVFDDGSTQPRTPCGEGSPNDGSGPVPLTCSVSSANGGINVSWNEIPDAVEYAWKLSVDGQSPKYRRVKATSTFIALPDGLIGSVSVTPVFADGSIRSRSQCGSAGPIDGTGNMPFTCSLMSAPGGVLIEWSEVGGAASYQYKLTIEGQGARYRRVTGTSMLVELPAGTVVAVGLAPVFEDGSTVSRSSCGSATAGDDPGDPVLPVVATCGLSDAGGDVARFTWTASNSGGLDSLTWKIVYTFGDPADPGGGGNEVARSFDPTARTYDITFQPGFRITGTIEIEEINGEFISPAIQVDCGEVTLADDGDPGDAVVVTACRVVDTGDGLAIEWEADNTEGRENITWKYEYQWKRAESQFPEADVGRAFDDDRRAVIFFAPGTFMLEAELQIEFVDGEFVGLPRTQCDVEGAIVGGVLGGPYCDAGGPDGQVRIGQPRYDFEVIKILTTLPDGSVTTDEVNEQGLYPVSGPPGSNVQVEAMAVLLDGTNTLTTDCGDTTIPVEP